MNTKQIIWDISKSINTNYDALSQAIKDKDTALATAIICGYDPKTGVKAQIKLSPIDLNAIIVGSMLYADVARISNLSFESDWQECKMHTLP